MTLILVQIQFRVLNKKKLIWPHCNDIISITYYNINKK